MGGCTAILSGNEGFLDHERLCQSAGVAILAMEIT
jgi:hypothetical protein